MASSQPAAAITTSAPITVTPSVPAATGAPTLTTPPVTGTYKAGQPTLAAPEKKSDAQPNGNAEKKNGDAEKAPKLPADEPVPGPTPDEEQSKPAPKANTFEPSKSEQDKSTSGT